MKRWLLILMALIFSAGCNAIEDDYSELFGQLTKDRYQFFELLDDYPSLKDGVASLEPALFNESLYRSLNLNPGAGAGFLQMLSDALLDTNPPVQNLFADLGSIMKRVRTANPSSYDTSMLYLERLRTSNYSLVYDGMPFQGSGFQDTFDTSNPSSVEDLVERTARLLQNPDPSDITDVQNSIIKILQTNATTRSATEGMFLSSLELAKSTGSSSLLQTLGQLADAMRQRAGYDNGTTARLATVTLLQNLSSYFQPGGAVYDADASYRDSEFPSDLRSQFIAIYDSVRPFLTANGAHTGSRPLLETLSEDLADLPQDVHQDADASLKKMIDLDAYGADRLNNVHSTKITALESLLFLLSLGNHFGYAWDDDPNNTNTITGATDGVITIGDVLYSLRSLIKGDPVLSLSGFLKDSQSSGLVQRNGSVLSFGINSPALALLQGQSTGSATSLADSGYTVYHRTVPYMLDWIVRVVYGGQGPYYNVNRTNGSGDYTTPDGTVYRTSGGTDLTYVSSWTTDTFRIRVKQFLSGGGSTNHYIGPGGYEDPSGNGTAFTVVESYIAPSNRAVTSDEQAMYKNFQWLLYKKRFVIVIPLHAKLGASGIEHAA
ncbi:MAG: hypothetical protein KDK33_07930 [Leptospiraceae bacterium]|nr:hypothetical protein [Leptospiraceae bacterium]